MQEVLHFIGQLEIDKPFGGTKIKFYPIRFREVADPEDYLTMDEAIVGEALEVIEKSEGGSVPELRVKNNSDRKVLLVDGEELVGAKQNRILNTTILVNAKTETIIPVTCVEQGRWGYRSRKFSPGSSAYSRLRRQKLEQVSRSLRERGDYKSDQSALWLEVNRKLDVSGSSSGTSELRQAYMDKQREVREQIGDAKPPDDANGVVVAIGEKIWCVDVFDKPSSLSKLWGKLSTAYAMDALEEEKEKPKAPSVDEARQFVEQASSARLEPYDSAGLGSDVRIEGDDVIGSALVYNDKVLHLSLFNRKIGDKPLA